MVTIVANSVELTVDKEGQLRRWSNYVAKPDMRDEGIGCRPFRIRIGEALVVTIRWDVDETDGPSVHIASLDGVASARVEQKHADEVMVEVDRLPEQFEIRVTRLKKKRLSVELGRIIDDAGPLWERAHRHPALQGQHRAQVRSGEGGTMNTAKVTWPPNVLKHFSFHEKVRTSDTLIHEMIEEIACSRRPGVEGILLSFHEHPDGLWFNVEHEDGILAPYALEELQHYLPDFPEARYIPDLETGEGGRIELHLPDGVAVTREAQVHEAEEQAVLLLYKSLLGEVFDPKKWQRLVTHDSPDDEWREFEIWRRFPDGMKALEPASLRVRVLALIHDYDRRRVDQELPVTTVLRQGLERIAEAHPHTPAGNLIGAAREALRRSPLPLPPMARAQYLYDQLAERRAEQEGREFDPLADTFSCLSRKEKILWASVYENVWVDVSKYEYVELLRTMDYEAEYQRLGCSPAAAEALAEETRTKIQYHDEHGCQIYEAATGPDSFLLEFARRARQAARATG